MSQESLSHELSQLSRKGLTNASLKALDFILPGQYQSTNSLEDLVQIVTRESRTGRIQAIANQAEQLYSERIGARRAVWLYKLTDSCDKAVAAAAFANKVGNKYALLSFLTDITPKASTSQKIDLCLKLVIEALAHLSLHGSSEEGFQAWLKALGSKKTYSNEAAMRLAAILALDGLVPLGPDFLKTLTDSVKKGELPWEGSPLFERAADYIPGDNMASKYEYINELLGKLASPAQEFLEKSGLTREKTLKALESFTDLTDSKLDYLAAFLDISTNFVSHTGVQSVARHLVEEAAERFGYDN